MKLRTPVFKIGGLKALLSEPNDAERIDFQVRGRVARNGDPGETRSFAALDDEIVIRFGHLNDDESQVSSPGKNRLLKNISADTMKALPNAFRNLVTKCQERCEGDATASRMQSLEFDQALAVLRERF
jgi:preprotein translocase subunit SecA